MATKPSDIPNLERQISNLQQEAGRFDSQLRSSPTALGGNGKPTASDISDQESLNRINSQIQSLEDSRLKTKWYGTDAKQKNAADSGEDSPGFFRSTLDYLSRPLYGVVGATKHFTGQGKGSLQQDVADNMVRNKNTFGDVLKNSNVPWAVAAPLGFALDITMDPVNWATMGTGALVPRLGMGLYKGVQTGEGALKGLSIAGKSSILEKASVAGRYTPFFRKSDAFKKLGEAAIKTTNSWEDLSGITAASIVSQGKGIGGSLFSGSYRLGLGDLIKKAAESTPNGAKILDNFIYDPVEWVRQARIKDVVQESLGQGADMKGAINAHLRGESIEPFLKQGAEEFSSAVKAASPVKVPFGIDTESVSALPTAKEVDTMVAKLAGTGLETKVAEAAPDIVNGVDDTASILKNPNTFISADPMENALRIANEKIGGEQITMEDIAKIVNSGALEETGVKWFDKMMGGIKSYTIQTNKNKDKAVAIGKNVMDKYDQAMGIFRAAKVGASPTAWTNAVVGNMIMTHMANGDVSPQFIARLKQSFDMYRNKSGSAAFLDGLLMSAGKSLGDENLIRRGILDNKTAARGTFGDLSFLNANDYAEVLLQRGRDNGMLSSAVKVDDIKDSLRGAMDELAEIRMNAGTEPVRGIIKAGKEVSRADIGTGMLSNEMFNSRATAAMFDHIAEKAKSDPSNIAWKLLDFTLNKMPSGYEKIDQTFKMATFLRATVDGYDINQLRQMRHLINMTPEELALGKYAKDGQNLYRLSPKSAIELANAMYLNYNAMPAAVRVLRNMPLMGSPFVSFMYGMALKTGQTLAYNPAAFNKVNFAMKDFGGTKTPLEKKALDTDFYSYLNQPGMFRLPFFEKNPIYLNMASMIPYYSLNMFNPSQTNYGDSAREQLTQALQGSPILKDPAGSVLFDYLIQPLILGEAIRPQGQFGQPLYPVDATGLEKLGYGARTFGEAFVPNITSYAGLLTPEEAAKYIPSYRWRQLSEAKEGKNQLGISSKEPKTSRTLRGLLQASGISVQAPVNTNFKDGGSAQ